MLQLKETMIVAENRHGYQFGIGLVGDRWIGFARGAEMLFVFPAIADDFQLGLLDKQRVIKLTVAIACDPDGGYGGIDQWFVTYDLRGHPDDFRCPYCARVGCQGECRDDFDYHFDDEELP